MDALVPAQDRRGHPREATRAGGVTAPRQIVVSDLWSNGKATRWPTPSEMERWPGPETFETEFHAYLRRRPNRRSALHGENHWHAVAATGLELCKRVPAADPSTVFHFAMAHDAERRNDGIDPDHGIRAAQVFADRWPYLHDFDVFAHACVGHTSGTRSRDPTIGVCWDADRLNLWRIGIRPDPRFLSTAAARDPKMIEMARGFHGKRYTWNRLAYDYAQEVCVPRLIEEKYGPMRPRSYADQIPPVESLPLDEHGRALLYHGTDRLSANKITQSGLRPTEPWFGEEGKGVFLVRLRGGHQPRVLDAAPKTRGIRHRGLRGCGRSEAAALRPRADPVRRARESLPFLRQDPDQGERYSAALGGNP